MSDDSAGIGILCRASEKAFRTWGAMRNRRHSACRNLNDRRAKHWLRQSMRWEDRVDDIIARLVMDGRTDISSMSWQEYIARQDHYRAMARRQFLRERGRGDR
ncbi:MAG: hypothetical protein H0W72_02335 [Planctomycetes bacterium]|nr:hypothetical protein [Planctomycetota bacterium]